MPLYEYKCEKCQAVFSELRSISQRNDAISCPECGGKAKVIISAFATGAGTSGSGSTPGGSCGPGFT
jgi:putative FmdB family regulatory protein